MSKMLVFQDKKNSSLDEIGERYGEIQLPPIPHKVTFLRPYVLIGVATGNT